MDSYNELIESLRSMEPMVCSTAADAIEALQSRVAELESRLEISPLHNVDGIMARDATIKLQDGRIAELEADRNTWRDKYIAQAGQLDLLKEAAAFLASERAEREKQEPVAWYIDGEDGREYNGTPKMSGGRIGTPLYAAPPVITQHEPVTTVEDRYNADGWINPNDKTQKQYLPHIGEKVLFCHAGVTYYGKHTGGSFQSFNPPRMFETWGCLWMYPPKAREVRS